MIDKSIELKLFSLVHAAIRQKKRTDHKNGYTLGEYFCHRISSHFAYSTANIGRQLRGIILRPP